ncbi:MAG: hypothetical protein JSS03_09980, partial [Proteobacteria bacterium]|nr:hypothetical protein [Pseudomonadota bacterium]
MPLIIKNNPWLGGVPGLVNAKLSDAFMPQSVSDKHDVLLDTISNVGHEYQDAANEWIANSQANAATNDLDRLNAQLRGGAPQTVGDYVARGIPQLGAILAAPELRIGSLAKAAPTMAKSAPWLLRLTEGAVAQTPRIALQSALDSASDTDENGNPTPGSELGSHFVRNVPMFAVPQVFGSNAVTRGLTGAASGAGMTAGMTALEGGEQDPQAIAANALTQGVLGAMHGNAPVTDDVLRATMNNTNASKAARMAAFNELGRRALVAEQARAAEELRQKAIEDAINQAMQSTEQSQTQTDGAAATDKPSTATDKPSTATDKPSTATDKPSTAT